MPRERTPMDGMTDGAGGQRDCILDRLVTGSFRSVRSIVVPFSAIRDPSV